MKAWNDRSDTLSRPEGFSIATEHRSHNDFQSKAGYASRAFMDGSGVFGPGLGCSAYMAPSHNIRLNRLRSIFSPTDVLDNAVAAGQQRQLRQGFDAQFLLDGRAMVTDGFIAQTQTFGGFLRTHASSQ